MNLGKTCSLLVPCVARSQLVSDPEEMLSVSGYPDQGAEQISWPTIFPWPLEGQQQCWAALCLGRGPAGSWGVKVLLVSDGHQPCLVDKDTGWKKSLWEGSRPCLVGARDPHGWRS